MAELSAPVPLLAKHVTDEFDCGEPVLNDWLKKRALKNESSGASRTFVVISHCVFTVNRQGIN
jgi:hypothetical protein